MKRDAWEDTRRFIDAEGREFEGECRLTKGNGQWIYTADWEDEGKKVMLNVTRKVKDIDCSNER